MKNKQQREVVHRYLNTVAPYVDSLEYYNDVNDGIQHAIEYVTLTKVGVKKGVKMFGDRGVAAI